MPTIGHKGENLDLIIRQGATVGPVHMLLEEDDGSPTDLTGCTLLAQIAKTADGPTIAGASGTFTVLDAAGGTAEFSFTDEATALLTADPDSETAAASTYVWGMDLHRADGSVTPLLYGVANVFRNIPKEA